MPPDLHVPPLIARLVTALEQVQRDCGVIGGRIGCKRNAAGEWVVALIAPPEYAAVTRRDQAAIDAERALRRATRRR